MDAAPSLWLGRQGSANDKAVLIVLHVNRALIVVNYMIWLVLIRSLMTSTGWLEMKRTRQPGEPTGPSISQIWKGN